MRHCPTVESAAVDEREKLPDRTLMKRQAAADVWGRRAVWQTQPSPYQGLRNEPAMLEYMWDWDYMDFAFMLDATSFTNVSTKASHHGEKAFKRKGVVWPPEKTKPGRNIRDACHLMAYTVLHPFLGVVLGPDFVYTGSSATNRDWSLAQGHLRGKHDQDYKHWCVHV